jgi:hypothetical protein
MKRNVTIVIDEHEVWSGDVSIGSIDGSAVQEAMLRREAWCAALEDGAVTDTDREQAQYFLGDPMR